ncbi:MAG TPA: hypothetical protein VGF40_06530 [Thermoanaerobaculia bacterium]
MDSHQCFDLAGIQAEDIRRWFINAGLTEVVVDDIGQKCRAASKSGGRPTAITIFAASGRKSGGES